MIRLVTRNLALRKFMVSTMSGIRVGPMCHEKPEWVDRPRVADYVLTAGSLNVPLERYASSLGAMAVVLPEGADYLIVQALVANAERRDLLMIGAEYVNPPKHTKSRPTLKQGMP